MNYFPVLVQEMEVKIPAPVCEVVALTATAWISPPVVLHEKSDSQSRCSVSFELISHPSYSVPQSCASTCWQQWLLPSSSPRTSSPSNSISSPKGEPHIGLASKREPDVKVALFFITFFLLEPSRDDGMHACSMIWMHHPTPMTVHSMGEEGILSFRLSANGGSSFGLQRCWSLVLAFSLFPISMRVGSYFHSTWFMVVSGFFVAMLY